MRTAREWALSISAVVVLLAAVAAAIAAVTGRWDRVAVKVPAPRTVVLYSSVDDPVLRAVAERFRQQMNIIVEIVGDTEATKTTGLVQRLLAEKDSPRADVWWSSEALGTVMLARAGVLEPMPSPPFDADGNAWPAEHKAADGSWHAFAQRARVIAYNSKWVNVSDVPRSLEALVDPAWKGRVGLARPQFGTTRAHMAAIAARHGHGALRRWLEALKANDVRLYDGNSTVARAVGMGEIDVGLVDTDDVWSAQRNAWPVSLAFEIPAAGSSGVAGAESPGGAMRQPDATSSGAAWTGGPLLIPNTVAVVKGAPHPAEARLLAEFLLAEHTEKLLATMEQHTLPIRPWLIEEADLKGFMIPDGAAVDWEKAADALPEAMKICEEVLGN